MFQSFKPRGDSPVSIIGAGIAGAWQALLFAQAGHAVTLYERSDAAMTLSTSHWAGGMLAPWCEAEASEPVIGRLGIRSLDLWREHFPEHPVQRLAGGGACARPRRFRTLCQTHVRPCQARRAGLARTRTVAGGAFPRRAVLRRRRPCRAAARAAGTACAHRRGRRPDQVRQRRERGRSRRHRDRLPRPCRARRRSRSCAASRAR